MGPMNFSADSEAMSNTVAPPRSSQPLTGDGLWQSIWPQLESAASGCSSLVVFDWDDTLLPTAALAVAGRIAPGVASLHQLCGSEAPAPAPLGKQEFDSFLESCTGAAIKVLREASQQGMVVIVTNSRAGWVQDSASRFMPRLLGELQNIPIVSARSVFEPLGILDPFRWKIECFRRLVQCFRSDSKKPAGPLSLVSIGDGWYERAAATMVAQDLELPRLMCIKFLERPRMDRLAEQLNLLCREFGNLADYPRWVFACCIYSDNGGLQLKQAEAPHVNDEACYTSTDILATDVVEARATPTDSPDRKVTEEFDASLAVEVTMLHEDSACPVSQPVTEILAECSFSKPLPRKKDRIRRGKPLTFSKNTGRCILRRHRLHSWRNCRRSKVRTPN